MGCPFDESLGKQIELAAVTASKDGQEFLSVTEAERQKVGDVMEREARLLIEFRTIEGFNYEIKNAYHGKEMRN